MTRSAVSLWACTPIGPIALPSAPDRAGAGASQRSQGLVWSAATLACGTLAWVVYGGGTGGLAQVVTFWHAEVWEFESPLGTVAWMLSGGSGRSESGASRFGTAPLWARVSLALCVLAVVDFAWAKVRSRDRIGDACVVSVASLLLSPLFSYPFVAWLAPWAAMASEGQGGRRRAWLTAIVCAMTLIAVASFGSKEESPWLTQSLLLARDAVLGWTLASSIRDLLSARRASALIGKGS